MHFLKHCETAKEAVFLEQGFLLSIAAYKPWELFRDNCSVMPYSCLLGNLLSCHHLGRLDGISPPDTGPLEFIVLSLSLLWWYHSSPPGFTRKSAFKGTQVVCLQEETPANILYAGVSLFDQPHSPEVLPGSSVPTKL